MAMNNNTANTVTSAFLVGLFAGRTPMAHPDAAEITDWEFVNNSDVSDDDFVYVISDDESRSIISEYKDRDAEDDEKFKSGGVSGIAVVVGDQESIDPLEENIYVYGDDLLKVISDGDSVRSSSLLSLSKDGYAKKDEIFKSAFAVVGMMTPGDEDAKESDAPLEEEVEDEDSEDDYDRFDLNDELVPWSVSDRFGRERMRKLGTRTKKFAYKVNRPGCFRGKHGLGRKA